jgi:hypothetical protein
MHSLQPLRSLAGSYSVCRIEDRALDPADLKFWNMPFARQVFCYVEKITPAKKPEFWGVDIPASCSSEEHFCLVFVFRYFCANSDVVEAIDRGRTRMVLRCFGEGSGQWPDSEMCNYIKL